MNRLFQSGLPLLFVTLAFFSALNSGAVAGKLDPMSAMSQSADGNKIQLGEDLGQMDDIGNEDSKTFLEKCLKVFGHPAFCHCVSGRLVSGTTFDNYVKFLLTPKAVLLYAKSSQTRRKAIDAAEVAKNSCVRSSFAVAGKAKPR